MKTRIFAIISVFCLFVCLNGFAQQYPVDPNKVDTAINLSFVQTARSGYIVPMEEKQGYYVLTLEKANPYTIFYAHRPSRVSGIAPTKNFVQAWRVGDNSFKNNNPNAVLIPAMIDGIANKSSMIKLVSLSQPIYNIGQEKLRYIIKPLPNEHFIFQEIHMNYVTLVIN